MPVHQIKTRYVSKVQCEKLLRGAAKNCQRLTLEPTTIESSIIGRTSVKLAVISKTLFSLFHWRIPVVTTINAINILEWIKSSDNMLFLFSLLLNKGIPKNTIKADSYESKDPKIIK